MKNINWKLGIRISFALSLITLSLRLTRADEIFPELVVLSFFYTLITCFGAWVIFSIIIAKRKELTGTQHEKLFAVLSIILIALLMFVFDWVFNIISDDKLQFIDGEGYKKFVNVTLRVFLLSSLFYFIIHHLQMLKEKQEHSLEIAALKQAQLKANISSLKEQLSPHFLFNTLSTLSTLTQEKNVKDFVDELANVYRYVLLYKEANTVKLQKELEFIDAYLHIIKTRMENALQVEISLAGNIQQSQIPPFTLQLLIENAIKHNIASRAKPLKIKLYNEAGDYLVLSNNLQHKNAAQNSTGIGLNNVRQRYQLLFDKEIIIEKNADSFTIKLPIISNEHTDN